MPAPSIVVSETIGQIYTKDYGTIKLDWVITNPDGNELVSLKVARSVYLPKTVTLEADVGFNPIDPNGSWTDSGLQLTKDYTSDQSVTYTITLKYLDSSNVEQDATPIVKSLAIPHISATVTSPLDDYCTNDCWDFRSKRAYATFEGKAALAGVNGKFIILVNADGMWKTEGTSVKFTTDSTLAYDSSNATTIGTDGITTDEHATEALYTAFAAAIAGATLKSTLSPSSYTNETSFTLTQDIVGEFGNTQMWGTVLPAHLSVNGLEYIKNLGTHEEANDGRTIYSHFTGGRVGSDLSVWMEEYFENPISGQSSFDIKYCVNDPNVKGVGDVELYLGLPHGASIVDFIPNEISDDSAIASSPDSSVLDNRWKISIKSPTISGTLDFGEGTVDNAVQAWAKFEGKAALSGNDGKTIIIHNADTKAPVTFATSSSIDVANSGWSGSSARIGTNGATTDTLATKALYLAIEGAINEGTLSATLDPTSWNDGVESFILTQNNYGSIGNSDFTHATGAGGVQIDSAAIYINTGAWSSGSSSFINGYSVNASAIFAGLTGLEGEDEWKPSLSLVNSDGTSVTFTLSSNLDETESTSSAIGTNFSASTAEIATLALHTAFSAAIAEGLLKAKITPHVLLSTDTSFTLTQLEFGTAGNTTMYGEAKSTYFNVNGSGYTSGTSAFTGGTGPTPFDAVAVHDLLPPTYGRIGTVYIDKPIGDGIVCFDTINSRVEVVDASSSSLLFEGKGNLNNKDNTIHFVDEAGFGFIPHESTDYYWMPINTQLSPSNIWQTGPCLTKGTSQTNIGYGDYSYKVEAFDSNTFDIKHCLVKDEIDTFIIICAMTDFKTGIASIENEFGEAVNKNWNIGFKNISPGFSIIYGHGSRVIEPSGLQTLIRVYLDTPLIQQNSETDPNTCVCTYPTFLKLGDEYDKFLEFISDIAVDSKKNIDTGWDVPKSLLNSDASLWDFDIGDFTFDGDEITKDSDYQKSSGIITELLFLANAGDPRFGEGAACLANNIDRILKEEQGDISGLKYNVIKKNAIAVGHYYRIFILGLITLVAKLPSLQSRLDFTWGKLMNAGEALCSFGLGVPHGISGGGGEPENYFTSNGEFVVHIHNQSLFSATSGIQVDFTNLKVELAKTGSGNAVDEGVTIVDNRSWGRHDYSGHNIHAYLRDGRDISESLHDKNYLQAYSPNSGRYLAVYNSKIKEVNSQSEYLQRPYDGMTHSETLLTTLVFDFSGVTGGATSAAGDALRAAIIDAIEEDLKSVVLLSNELVTRPASTDWTGSSNAAGGGEKVDAKDFLTTLMFALEGKSIVPETHLISDHIQSVIKLPMDGTIVEGKGRGTYKGVGEYFGLSSIDLSGNSYPTGEALNAINVDRDGSGNIDIVDLVALRNLFIIKNVYPDRSPSNNSKFGLVPTVKCTVFDTDITFLLPTNCSTFCVVPACFSKVWISDFGAYSSGGVNEYVAEISCSVDCADESGDIVKDISGVQFRIEGLKNNGIDRAEHFGVLDVDGDIQTHTAIGKKKWREEIVNSSTYASSDGESCETKSLNRPTKDTYFAFSTGGNTAAIHENSYITKGKNVLCYLVIPSDSLPANEDRLETASLYLNTATNNSAKVYSSTGGQAAISSVGLAAPVEDPTYVVVKTDSKYSIERDHQPGRNYASLIAYYQMGNSKMSSEIWPDQGSGGGWGGSSGGGAPDWAKDVDTEGRDALEALGGAKTSQGLLHVYEYRYENNAACGYESHSKGYMHNTALRPLARGFVNRSGSEEPVEEVRAVRGGVATWAWEAPRAAPANAQYYGGRDWEGDRNNVKMWPWTPDSISEEGYSPWLTYFNYRLDLRDEDRNHFLLVGKQTPGDVSQEFMLSKGRENWLSSAIMPNISSDSFKLSESKNSYGDSQGMPVGHATTPSDSSDWSIEHHHDKWENTFLISFWLNPEELERQLARSFTPKGTSTSVDMSGADFSMTNHELGLSTGCITLYEENSHEIPQNLFGLQDDVLREILPPSYGGENASLEKIKEFMIKYAKISEIYNGQEEYASNNQDALRLHTNSAYEYTKKTEVKLLRDGWARYFISQEAEYEIGCDIEVSKTWIPPKYESAGHFDENSVAYTAGMTPWAGGKAVKKHYRDDGTLRAGEGVFSEGGAFNLWGAREELTQVLGKPIYGQIPPDPTMLYGGIRKPDYALVEGTLRDLIMKHGGSISYARTHARQTYENSAGELNKQRLTRMCLSTSKWGRRWVGRSVEVYVEGAQYADGANAWAGGDDFVHGRKTAFIYNDLTNMGWQVIGDAEENIEGETCGIVVGREDTLDRGPCREGSEKVIGLFGHWVPYEPGDLDDGIEGKDWFWMWINSDYKETVHDKQSKYLFGSEGHEHWRIVPGYWKISETEVDCRETSVVASYTSYDDSNEYTKKEIGEYIAYRDGGMNDPKIRVETHKYISSLDPTGDVYEYGIQKLNKVKDLQKKLKKKRIYPKSPIEQANFYLADADDEQRRPCWVDTLGNKIYFNYSFDRSGMVGRKRGTYGLLGYSAEAGGSKGGITPNTDAHDLSLGQHVALLYIGGAGSSNTAMGYDAQHHRVFLWVDGQLIPSEVPDDLAASYIGVHAEHATNGTLHQGISRVGNKRITSFGGKTNGNFTFAKCNATELPRGRELSYEMPEAVMCGAVTDLAIFQGGEVGLLQNPDSPDVFLSDTGEKTKWDWLFDNRNSFDSYKNMKSSLITKLYLKGGSDVNHMFADWKKLQKGHAEGEVHRTNSKNKAMYVPQVVAKNIVSGSFPLSNIKFKSYHTDELEIFDRFGIRVTDAIVTSNRKYGSSSYSFITTEADSGWVGYDSGSPAAITEEDMSAALTYAASGLYDATYDSNGSGIVNILDIQALAHLLYSDKFGAGFTTNYVVPRECCPTYAPDMPNLKLVDFKDNVVSVAMSGSKNIVDIDVDGNEFGCASDQNNQRGIFLQWDPVDNADYYIVYRLEPGEGKAAVPIIASSLEGTLESPKEYSKRNRYDRTPIQIAATTWIDFPPRLPPKVCLEYDSSDNDFDDQSEEYKYWVEAVNKSYKTKSNTPVGYTVNCNYKPEPAAQGFRFPPASYPDSTKYHGDFAVSHPFMENVNVLAGSDDLKIWTYLKGSKANNGFSIQGGTVATDGSSPSYNDGAANSFGFEYYPPNNFVGEDSFTYTAKVEDLDNPNRAEWCEATGVVRVWVKPRIPSLEIIQGSCCDADERGKITLNWRGTKGTEEYEIWFLDTAPNPDVWVYKTTLKAADHTRASMNYSGPRDYTFTEEPSTWSAWDQSCDNNTLTVTYKVKASAPIAMGSSDDAYKTEKEVEGILVCCSDSDVYLTNPTISSVTSEDLCASGVDYGDRTKSRSVEVKYSAITGAYLYKIWRRKYGADLSGGFTDASNKEDWIDIGEQVVNDAAITSYTFIDSTANTVDGCGTVEVKYDYFVTTRSQCGDDPDVFTTPSPTPAIATLPACQQRLKVADKLIIVEKGVTKSINLQEYTQNSVTKTPFASWSSPTIVSGSGIGTINNFVSSAGTFDFVPTVGQHGLITMTWTATDGCSTPLTSASATLTIQVKQYSKEDLQCIDDNPDNFTNICTYWLNPELSHQQDTFGIRQKISTLEQVPFMFNIKGAPSLRATRKAYVLSASEQPRGEKGSDGMFYPGGPSDLGGGAVDQFGEPVITEQVTGCTSRWATNYDPDANIDDGSCTWPTSGTDAAVLIPAGDFKYGPPAVEAYALFHFDGGLTDEAGGQDATIVGSTATYTASGAGTAFGDGITFTNSSQTSPTDYIILPDPMVGEGDFEIEFFVDLQNTTNNQGLLSNMSGTNPQNQFCLLAASPTTFQLLQFVNGVSSQITWDLPSGSSTWIGNMTHIALTRTVPYELGGPFHGLWYLWVDGIPLTASSGYSSYIWPLETTPIMDLDGTDWRLGWANQGGTVTQGIDGTASYDEVKIVNTPFDILRYPFDQVYPPPTAPYLVAPNWTSIETLPAFYIGKYSVTAAQYAECVQAGACTPPSWVASNDIGIPDMTCSGCFYNDTSNPHYYGSAYGRPGYNDWPINWVNYSQMLQYCSWVGGRLPTEMEWEKAARGTDGRSFPWGEHLNGNYIWGPGVSDGHGTDDTSHGFGGQFIDTGYLGGIAGTSTAVGWDIVFGQPDTGFGSRTGWIWNATSYPDGRSPYGLYQMSGNVSEATSTPTSVLGDAAITKGGTYARWIIKPHQFTTYFQGEIAVIGSGTEGEWTRGHSSMGFRVAFDAPNAHSALFHFDDGGFVESCSGAIVATELGAGPVIDSTQSYFGYKSLRLDGNYGINIPSRTGVTDLGHAPATSPGLLEDFTIDWFMRIDDTTFPWNGASQRTSSILNSGGTFTGFGTAGLPGAWKMELETNSGAATKLYFKLGANSWNQQFTVDPLITTSMPNGAGSLTNFTGSTDPLLYDQWHHWAIELSGDYINFYLNGYRYLAYNVSASGLVPNYWEGLDYYGINIGDPMQNYTGGGGLEGNIDEFRVSKGVARYSSSSGLADGAIGQAFTPPTGAYSC